MVRKSSSSKKSALTLIEVLVVIGIALVLLAILLPTYIGAKRRANDATDLSKLRQYATAVNVYTGDADSSKMPTAKTLFTAGHLNRDTLSLACDPNPEGALLVEYRFNREPTPATRTSVIPWSDRVSIGEFSSEYYASQMPSAKLDAIVVAPAGHYLEGAKGDRSFTFLQGAYHRLGIDGSVRTRDVQADYYRYPYWEDHGNFKTTCGRTMLWYFEVDERDFVKWCAESLKKK